MTDAQALIIVLIIALFTLLTRALPFLLFPAGKTTPDLVSFLGKVLPYSIMGMLVIYCLKDPAVTSAPRGLAEAVSIGMIILVHLWRRSSLLSVATGTVCYMVLIQTFFA